MNAAGQFLDRCRRTFQQRDTQELSEKAKKKISRTPEPTQPGIPSYSQSRAVKEAYLARISRLQYEEMTGQLVRENGVKTEAFRRGRMVRDQILSVPDRLASILAAEDDAAEVCRLLEQELRTALEALADE